MTQQITPNWKPFDSIADEYEKLWTFSKEYESEMLKNIVDFLNFNHDDRFIDIGGGNGKYTLKIARKARLCNEPICVEPSDMADIAKINESLVTYKEDAFRFLERCKQYDKVLIKEAIHHIEDRVEVFRKIYSQISNNGKLLIVTRPKYPKMPFFKKYKDVFAEGQPYTSEIEKDLREAGFFVEVNIKHFKFDMHKERWFKLLRKRFMSDLSKLSDEEIESGIIELSKKHKEDTLKIQDDIIFLVASKKI